jgi:hypothetical protein
MVTAFIPNDTLFFVPKHEMTGPSRFAKR